MPNSTSPDLARRLRDVCEPIAANVYFAPEAQARYAALGLTYGPGYFCSRGGCLGRAPGEVIAAAFGVFSPAVVVPAVSEGWSKTDPPTILRARLEGAIASLQRLLGTPEPSSLARASDLLEEGLDAVHGLGHVLYSGLRSLPMPTKPLARLWRLCDLVREHRGDSHIASWLDAGVPPAATNLLFELAYEIPLNTYARTRGWSKDASEAALETLAAKGWVRRDADTWELTDAGRAGRQAIEDATSAQERPIVDQLGDERAQEVIEILRPWARAIVAAGVEGGGYPSRVADVAKMR